MSSIGALLTERNDSYLAPLSLTDQCLEERLAHGVSQKGVIHLQYSI